MSTNDKVNNRNYWISPDGKYALWYDPKYKNWIIGRKSDLGTSTGYLKSKFDAPCPDIDGNKWMFYTGDKWVDAGNDARVGIFDGESQLVLSHFCNYYFGGNRKFFNILATNEPRNKKSSSN